MKKLVILADRDRLRAFCVVLDDFFDTHSQIAELCALRLGEFRAVTDVSDRSGQFKVPSGRRQTSDPHGREQEAERRAIESVAREILLLLEGEDGDDYETWNLAAPAQICDRLVRKLPMGAKERLTRVEHGDYTKLPTDEVRKMFAT